jgi:Big-like domain-containing protein
MRALLALAVLLCGLGGQAEAACAVPDWRFVWDVETNAYMTTDGGRCSLVFRRAFRTSEVHSIGMATAPRNGSATVSGNSVFYTPRSGFKGDDSFVFAINGKRNGSAVRATVKVNVTVR